MSKGSRRRPTQISEAEEQKRWDEAFGKREIPTVMSDEERLQFEAERDALAQLQSGEEDENGE